MPLLCLAPFVHHSFRLVSFLHCPAYPVLRFLSSFTPSFAWPPSQLSFLPSSFRTRTHSLRSFPQHRHSRSQADGRQIRGKERTEPGARVELEAKTAMQWLVRRGSPVVDSSVLSTSCTVCPGSGLRAAGDPLQVTDQGECPVRPSQARSCLSTQRNASPNELATQHTAGSSATRHLHRHHAPFLAALSRRYSRNSGTTSPSSGRVSSYVRTSMPRLWHAPTVLPFHLPMGAHLCST